jgi:peptide deformylase
MKIKIVKDKTYLHRPTTPVESLEEGNEIAEKLILTLERLKFGIGLSACQIGISKSVSVVWARKDDPPVVLMNPKIVEVSDEKIGYLEGCLSIPGKQVRTIRHQRISIETLNHANSIPFGPDVTPVTSDTIPDDLGVLECICVQHEIDHTNGILITDIGVRAPIIAEKTIKHGRNDKVVVEKNGETQYIKYKKALILLSEGWKII